MPAISTLSLAVGFPGSNTFDSSELSFTAESPPSWFQLTLTGINPIGPVASYEYTVTPTAPPGVYTIELSPGLEYIVITITGSADTTFTICVGESDNYYLVGSSFDVPWEAVGTWPDYLSIIDGPLNDVTIQAVGVEVCDTYVTLGAYVEDVLTDIWVVRLIVTQCGLTDDTCQAYPIRITWLNPAGGWSSYIFNGKKTYGVDIGGGKTYKDSDRISRYSQIDNVFDTVIQPSGLIPETHVDFLKTLRYSIQAYVYDVQSGGEIVTYPIFNYAKGFELKKQSNGFYKYDFEFSYSEEIIIQTR